MNNLLKLIRGREIQLKAVVVTALASYVLQLSAILLHWHLWAIALVTILPWIPLFTMKVLWNSKHYGFMAIYSVLMLVQAGHVMEHVVQMGQFIFYTEHPYTGQVLSIDPTTLNKPVVVVTANDPSQSDVSIVKDPAAPAITIQSTGQTINGRAVTFLGCKGWNWNTSGCSAAHGVFGELDRELIHFVWDGMILIACTVLFFRFRDNPWTKWALLFAFIHQIEHIYLFGASLIPTVSGYPGKGTFLGLAVQQVDSGILGHNGIVGTVTGLDGFINNILPSRINIHFIYNVMVIIPMVGAFIYQVRRIYDEWLAKALPSLNREQLIQFSTNAEVATFDAGQTIFNQGDAADRFYIITKGKVEVLRGDKRGVQKPVTQLNEGDYFGEIGILGRTRRTATIKAITPVEVLTLDETTFRLMIAASGESYKDVDVVVKRRIKQLGAVQGKNLAQKVDADPDALVKSRIIQNWLDDMEYKSQLLNWNGLAEPVDARKVPVGVGAGQPLQPTSSNGSAAQASGGYAPTVASPVAPYGAGVVVAPPGALIGSLKVRSGPSSGQRFEINAPRVVVGRRSSKVLPVPLFMVDDSRVSREHVEIVQQPDGVYLRDLGSANGTWLNGVQLEGTPVRLDDGAEIRLGTDTVLTFRYGQ
ncbi:MAG TPA: cyclic nucleotide-binding domain-containing protein [Chloroflexia bacterium]|nr:cyclic nucleotide-binding domain-containing protein [Chloroflexia bacterium]